MLIAVLVVFVKLLYLVFVVIVINLSTVKKNRIAFIFQIIVFLTHLDNTNATDSITKFFNNNQTTITPIIYVYTSFLSIVAVFVICFLLKKLVKKLSKNVQQHKLDVEHDKEMKV
uniref:Candidate secreted effector n=1 Tax=Meloidogyne incognita TaxID=6306 RepID=A0A914N1S8_MELIC